MDDLDPQPGDPELDRMKRQSMMETALQASSMSADLFKWTLASLLVLNGGALVALIGAEDLRTAAFEVAALLFGAGLLSALVGGFCNSMAYALLAADSFRAAIDPQPICAGDVEGMRSKPETKGWLIAGLLISVGCFCLFAAGCFSMLYVPGAAATEKALTELDEATARYLTESDAMLEVLQDRGATPQQREIAIERARAAKVEAEYRTSRAKASLGLP